ncbi:competence protein TfoX [Oceanicola sp. 22II-s10i]|uniref:TfoX/Sxy family DNA transformation protein n=1 Tax=Oceanicola sp. 22II-s10i TaxID=1317116 RepID=UPI000B520811|nr:TfoX/Sxy family DNA transformation protein [Oceanicola sp. 22II-s10i]OWU84780.1 competence protein TfoX [Oceanicola sp. 22II-s10i]
MAEPVTAIRNIGPATAEDFHRAGITSADEIRQMGAEAAYLAYLRAGGMPHFIGFYALVMGLQGRPWNDCGPEEKAALRVVFDRLKSEAAGSRAPAGIEKILDEIGVRAKPR